MLGLKPHLNIIHNPVAVLGIGHSLPVAGPAIDTGVNIPVSLTFPLTDTEQTVTSTVTYSGLQMSGTGIFTFV